MKLFAKKLNQKGLLSFHIILPVALVILAVAGVGTYVVQKSKATSYLSSTGCQIRGRVWVGGSGNPCSNRCVSGAGALVSASPYNYCSGAVSKISYSTCTNNNRVWVDNGCARRWQQTDKVSVIQCKSSSMTYYVMNPYDKCGYAKSTSTTSTKTTTQPIYTCPSSYKLIAVSSARIQSPSSILSTDIIDGRTCETTASNVGTVLAQYWYVKPSKS